MCLPSLAPATGRGRSFAELGALSALCDAHSATLEASKGALVDMLLARHVAGVVITSGVPDQALVQGKRGRVCDCGRKLDFGAAETAACQQCTRRHGTRGASVRERRV